MRVVLAILLLHLLFSLQDVRKWYHQFCGPPAFNIDFMSQPLQADPEIIVLSLALSLDGTPIANG